MFHYLILAPVTITAAVILLLFGGMVTILFVLAIAAMYLLIPPHKPDERGRH